MEYYSKRYRRCKFTNYVKCNLIYQDIILLVGNKFLDKWVNNYEPLVDYFDLFQSEIEKKYGKKLKKDIITNLLKLSIMIKVNYDSDFEKEVRKKREVLEQEYFELENKEMYLVKASKTKKQKEKEIKELDKILNDKKLLIQEYEKRNEDLPLEKKIFSIRVLKNILKEERNKILEDISEYNKIMNPKNFLERKNLIEQKLKYIIDLEDIEIEEEIEKSLINLQKDIIKSMCIDVKNAEDKNQLINLVYQYRYYNLLPIDNNNLICDQKELKLYLKKLSKIIIDKAIELKAIIKISDNEEINNRITNQLFLSKIISLEDINIKFTNPKDSIYLTVYDEEIEDTKIKLENIAKENINIKINKKVKLFI